MSQSAMSIAASAAVPTPSGPELDDLVEQPVLQHGLVERVLADQRVGHVVLDHAECGETTQHRAHLAEPADARIGLDADEAASPARVQARQSKVEVAPFHLEHVNRRDAQ